MSTAIELALKDDIITVLRAAGLKDGNRPVRNFFAALDAAELSKTRLPAIEIEETDVTDENFTSHSRIGNVNYELIVWVLGRNSIANKRRAKNLRYDVQKAIRAATTLGADKGVIWFEFDMHGVDYKQPEATGAGMTIRCTVTEPTV